ncbi:GAF domain-containing protein, partial [Roseisolibacter sp. H3M3-2]|uniref:GAF domain-containing protein n=1 Tax=Roseisolibacter sp. H3M3-2 TaxID=3031323 RepID=UPI0023DBA6AD
RQLAERLQRVQEAGAALARSLDAQAVVRELARQAARLVPHDGLVVAHPDVEGGVVRTALRQLHGLQRPRADQPLGAGPIAEVARTGTTVRVDDYDPARSPLAAADDVVMEGGPARSVLAVPMRVGTQLVGVLAVHAVAPRAFGEEHGELLRTLAAQAGTALANARLFAESEAERRQGEALVAVARAVSGSLRLGEVLRLVLRHTVGLLHAEGACVALRRDGWLHVVAGVGSAELLAGVHLPLEGSLPGRATLDGASVVRNDVARDPRAFGALEGVVEVAQTVVVPLRAAEGPIGAICVVNRAPDFDAHDARVLERLAEHVTVAIVNARLFEEVEASTREWQVSFDAIAAGMVVLDEDGRVLRANARAAELLGAAGARALAGASLDARLAGQDDPQRHGHAPVTSVVHVDDEPPDAEARARRASAVVRHALRRGAPQRALVRAAG